MDSSEPLHLDEHLARLLAAYDHGLDEADGHAPTIDVRIYQDGERRVPPLSGSNLNQGSLNDLLPDASRGDPFVVVSTASTPEIHRVGRFELRKQLGRGGCGIVFLAYDPKLKRDVALKIPRPELLMSPDARKRLVREATAAASFDHPNLVPVYETGEIGPICFIATVFCPGLTLSEWLDRQAFPVPVRQTARLVSLLAEAVQHAHDRGVLHRDLKPNNVILQEVKTDPNQQDAPSGACLLRGDYYTPRIVDFGLAKLADSGPGETATRQVLGTPKYMAPEQAQARHEDVGPEADVYALGGILYEMLTGRAPYEGATDVEVLRQCIEGNLTPPRHLRKDIPHDLEAICIKAMARQPARRYRTAIDFADDLRRFLDGLPTIARPLNAFGRGSRWLRRHDQMFALVTVTTISVVLLASGVWSAYQTQKLQVIRDESKVRDAERVRLENARNYARQVHDAFHFWQAGQREPMEQSLLDAKVAIGMNGAAPEFAWGFLKNRMRQANAPLESSAPQARAVAVSPDGKWLASGHADGMLRIWSREPLRPVAASRAHSGSIERVAFAGPSRVHAEAGRLVLVWELSESGTARSVSFDPKLDAHTAVSASVAISPDGTVKLLGRAVRTLSGSGKATSATISNDGRTVAAICDEDSVCVWNLETGTRETHREFGQPLHGIAFAPDHRTVYLAAEDGLHILDALAAPAGLIRRDLPSAAAVLAIRPESTEHAIGYSDGSVEIHASRGSAPKRFPPQERRPLAVLRFPQSGPPVGVEIGEDHVSVWQFGETAKLALRKPVRASAVDLHSSGESLAVAEPNGRVTVWQVGTGEALGTVDTKHGQPPRCLSFADGGRWLAVPVEGNGIGLWFIGEATIPLRVVGHKEGVSLFRYIGDDRLATAGRGRSIKVWNLMTLREEATLLGHTGRIASLASSPDLRTLASGDYNGNVKLWDLRTGHELLGIARHGGPVLSAEFAPDGKFLLTGSVFRNRGELAYWDSVKE